MCLIGLCSPQDDSYVLNADMITLARVLNRTDDSSTLNKTSFVCITIQNMTQ